MPLVQHLSLSYVELVKPTSPFCFHQVPIVKPEKEKKEKLGLH